MGAKYQKYPEYKDSGVEWVGDIPSSWIVEPLFASNDPRSIKNSDGSEMNVLSLSYGNIIRRDVDKNHGLLPASFNTYQIVNKGDLVLRLTDLQNDWNSLRVGHAKERGIITSAYLKLISNEQKLASSYFYRLLHSYDTTKVFYGMGGGLRQSMKFDDMRRLPVIVPPLPEQKQIAKFLDYETGKIDRLIEKQQELIALLKEKRQAVISHAVTKGLNPNAPMKPSGIEWLGDVPEHWTVKRLKHSIESGSSISYGIVQPGQPLDDGVPFIQTTNISKGEFHVDRLQKTTKQIERLYPRSRLHGGEVILGIRASIGAAYVVQDYMAGYNLSRGIARIATSERVYAEFLVWLLRSDVTFIYWGLSSQGSTFSEVSIDTVKELYLSLPPLDEQRAISKYISKIDQEFSNLISETERQAILLQERRTALISAAVTGKIDVRSWTAPKEPVQNVE